MSKKSSHFITVNNTRLFYTKTGTGTPLILLHGNGEDHSIFDKLSEKLSKSYTLYAIDSRNHGQSDKTNDYSYATMAEDIYAFIKLLQPEPVYILGFSDGAIISLMLMMIHPETVQKAALLGVNLKPSDFTDESYAYVKETYEKTGDPLFKMMLEQPNIELDAVKNVNHPILLIAAENDIYKPGLYNNLRATLPDAKLIIMQGHDHASYIIGQDILYPELEEFFHA